MGGMGVGDLAFRLYFERVGGKGGVESVARAAGCVLLEAELLGAGGEVFVAGLLCSGRPVGESGAEVLLAAALVEASLGSGASAMDVQRDVEGDVRARSLVAGGGVEVRGERW